jgi:predicted amidohydrolase YtcJ
MSGDEHEVSRRAVLKTGVATGAAAAGGIALAGSAAAATKPGAPGAPGGPGGRGDHGHTSPAGNLILSNGQIHTMDSARSVASMVAIRRGVIVYVGHRPGNHTPLENAYSIADVQALYAARAATLPPSDYAARLQALGGGVNLTPYEYFSTANPGGPPYRMLVDSGIPVGLSPDGMQIAPMNPWIHAYYATTGINALGDQINPGQQLTRAEVLEHFTSANRWFLGGRDEDVLGTLEVGRLGDVVVLSHDYFEVPDAGLKELHSVLTVLGGRVVHSGAIRYWA